MKNILGYRDYSSQRKIRETIKSSVNYRGENIESSELVCLFETSKQRTWFVATEKRVYLILDDIRKDIVKVNKSYRFNTIYSNEKLVIKIDSNYKTLTGRIYFKDSTRGWLYSKSLFPNKIDLHNTINTIMKRLI